MTPNGYRYAALLAELTGLQGTKVQLSSAMEIKAHIDRAMQVGRNKTVAFWKMLSHQDNTLNKHDFLRVLFSLITKTPCHHTWLGCGNLSLANLVG